MIEASAIDDVARASASLAVRLHDIDLAFRGAPSIIAAITERLGQLPASLVEQPVSLRFDYGIAASPDTCGCERPCGEGRSFYQPEAGEASYWPDSDICYLELGSCAKVLCHPAAGTCVVSLLEPVDSRLWLAAHPLLTLPLLEMLKRRNLFFVHAASFAIDGRCLLLPGSSGSGKSTLCVALLQAGFAYMGDDIAFLDGEKAEQVLAFPESISATDETLSFFPDSANWSPRAQFLEAQLGGKTKHEIPPAALATVPICWQATPAALVFPEIAHTQGSVASSMSTDEALSRLAANLLLTERRSTQSHLAALAALARSVPAYRFRTGTNFAEASSRLRELLS